MRRSLVGRFDAHVLAAIAVGLALVLAWDPARAQCGPDGAPPCNPNLPFLDCCKPIDYVASADPNDKVGPLGIGSQHAVARQAFLPYVIHFENLAAATAPAQEVRVTDELDLAVFELGTFSFVAFGFGDTTLTLPPGQPSVAVDVDLRPAQQLIVRFEGALNATSGALTCRYRALDPTTLDPIDDPLGGFLPPNQTPPEGEGFVSFVVRAKAGLPTGTRIENTARIVFDANAPIDTPEWFNTVDADDPDSQVDALPAYAPRRDFGVSWGGSDAGSGVRDFTIFVSDDFGPYETWIPTTTALADTFPGVHGHTYRFYAVARDSVGNLEAVPPGADATTVLDTTTAALPSLVDAKSDDGVVRVLWFASEHEGSWLVERRTEESEWLAVGAPTAVGRDLLEFEDADVSPGERYGYRLAVPREGGMSYFGEVWIDVRASVEFALSGPQPNPCTNPIVLDYALPGDGDAVLEVFDVLGRRVLARRLGRLGAGNHRYSLADSGPLRAGGYLVRLTYEGRALSRKIVVMP